MRVIYREPIDHQSGFGEQPKTIIMSNVTVFDVADLAGVSIKTVSRVVNGEPHVRPSTKERVDRAIASLNYRPDEAAQQLARHRAQRSA